MEAFVLVHMDMRGENDYQQKINRVSFLRYTYSHNNIDITMFLYFFHCCFF
jgi:hypothetical protein